MKFNNMYNRREEEMKKWTSFGGGKGVTKNDWEWIRGLLFTIFPATTFHYPDEDMSPLLYQRVPYTPDPNGMKKTLLPPAHLRKRETACHRFNAICVFLHFVCIYVKCLHIRV